MNVICICKTRKKNQEKYESIFNIEIEFNCQSNLISFMHMILTVLYF
jgi:hypothetical protein